MSAVRISLPSRNKILLPATSISTKQLCPGDDRSYIYISRMLECCRATVRILCAQKTIEYVILMYH